MKDCAVIYKTKYGSAARYAAWIAEDLDCEALCLDDLSKTRLKSYRTIIYGGGLHAGGIRGFDRMKKLLKPFLMGYESNDEGEKPRVILFAVGLTVDEKDVRMQVRDINLDKEYLKGLPCFFLRGAYDPAKVRGFDKMLMKVVRNMAGSKSGSESGDKDETELVKFIDCGCDMVSREQIAPIVEEARK